MRAMNAYHTAKETVLKACLELARAGFIPGTGGNVALRVDENAFAVTPSGIDYFQMSPDDICVLETSTLRGIEGRLKPSVESGMHARFFRARSDIRASVHTHQPIASAITLLNQPLLVKDPKIARALGATIPIVGYAPSGTSFLARAFQRAVRPDANAYLLRNHGIVCGGRNLPETIDNVRYLEAAAIAYLEETIRGRPTDALPEAIKCRVLELIAAARPLERSANPSSVL